MDIQHMEQRIEEGNRYLLITVGKVSKFLFIFPLSTKKALEMTRTPPSVIRSFGLPVSLRSDPRWSSVYTVIEQGG